MTTFKTVRAALFACSALALATPVQAQEVADPWENWETNDLQSAATSNMSPAEALEQELDTFAAAEKERVGRNLAVDARSETGDPTFGPVPSSIQVESGISGETVKLTFASAVSGWDDFQETKYSISFSAPFDKDDKRGSFITQSGLPDAYSAEIALSGSIVAPQEPAPFAGPSVVTLINLSGPARARCLDDNKKPDPEDDGSKTCNALSFSALIEKYGTKSEKDQKRKMFQAITNQLGNQKYVGWQIAGSVGREAFDHRDPVTLAKIDADKTVFSLSSSITYVPQIDKPLTYLIGAEVERDFELPTAETRCPADAGGNPTVTCFTAAFGPPQRETASTVFAAIRYTNIDDFPIGGELRLALNPETGDWGAEMPIYFLRSAKGKLNGGVRLAYDSKKDDGFVGLFVGTVLEGL
ncbi:MAG: hypothetical protein SXU28_09955 [Pseudomonadota bacterium]|nr:hypothetical protein [Pseudomonadota bacterium]